MKLNIVYILAFFYCIQVSAIEYGVAIPVSHNPQTNEWSVLLGLHNNTEWGPFQAPLKKGEKANKAAERALNTGTNGLYSTSIHSMPWEKIDNYFYHLVPVATFIRGNQLYEKGRNHEITDFAWVPVSQLLAPGPIKIKQTSNAIVANHFLVPFQTIWKNKSPQLTTAQPVAAQAQQQMPPSAYSSKSESPWLAYAAQATSWQHIPGAIYFYEKSSPYYEFTNFYPVDVPLDNKIWPTSEHYYQAMKFTDPHLQETIRMAATPREAFNIGQKNKASVRSDWHAINLDVMRKAVRAKFTHNPSLQKLLLKTGNTVLVENAGKNDAFYGAGEDYKGKNWLGRILMEIREELRTPKSNIAPLISLLHTFEQSLTLLRNAL